MAFSWTRISQSMKWRIINLLRKANLPSQVCDHFTSQSDTQNFLFHQEPRIGFAAHVEFGTIRSSGHRWQDSLRTG
jgi:hypothetical protein